MILHDMWTDFHDTADTGRIMTGIVLAAMILIQLVDTAQGHGFNAQNFGVGCGAVIGALAAYIWGDARGQQMTQPPPGTIIDTTRRTIEQTPNATGAPVAAAQPIPSQEVNQYHG